MSDAARHDNVKQLFVRIADATLDLPKVVAALSKVQYAIANTSCAYEDVAAWDLFCSQFATALSVFPQVWDIAILEFEARTEDGFGEDEIHPFAVGSPGTQDKLAEEVWTHQVVGGRDAAWIMANDAKVFAAARTGVQEVPGPTSPAWTMISRLTPEQLNLYAQEACKVLCAALRGFFTEGPLFRLMDRQLKLNRPIDAFLQVNKIMHKQKTAMTLENAIYDLDSLIWDPELCARSFVTELERLYEALLKQEPKNDKTSYNKLYVKLKAKFRRAKYTNFRDMFRRYDSTFRAGETVTVDNWTQLTTELVNDHSEDVPESIGRIYASTNPSDLLPPGAQPPAPSTFAATPQQGYQARQRPQRQQPYQSGYQGGGDQQQPEPETKFPRTTKDFSKDDPCWIKYINRQGEVAKCGQKHEGGPAKCPHIGHRVTKDGKQYYPPGGVFGDKPQVHQKCLAIMQQIAYRGGHVHPAQLAFLEQANNDALP